MSVNNARMKITCRLAAPSDADALVALFDGAARWMQLNGIAQWKPGDKDADHFLRWIKEGEVWIAETSHDEAIGAYELWWEDQAAWGIQPPVAGYVHRLMIDRNTAPEGFGRLLLGHAEQRVAGTGRSSYGSTACRAIRRCGRTTRPPGTAWSVRSRARWPLTAAATAWSCWRSPSTEKASRAPSPSRV